MKRKIVSVVVALCTLFLNCTIVRADADKNSCEVGIAIIGDYPDWSDLNNLSSPYQIRNDIQAAFKKGNAKNWSVGFTKSDSNLRKSYFQGTSFGGKDKEYADDVDLLFYAGHGLKPNTHGASDYSFALDYYQSKKYANQSKMRLGDRDLEWMITFTCNFCHGGMASLGQMAQGIHSICGYRTGVILVPNMGSDICDKLKKGITVKEAFFATSKLTQPWKDDVFGSQRSAAVFTTKTCANDCIWGYGSVAADPPRYQKDSSDYVMYIYNF